MVLVLVPVMPFCRYVTGLLARGVERLVVYFNSDQPMQPSSKWNPRRRPPSATDVDSSRAATPAPPPLLARKREGRSARGSVALHARCCFCL